MNISFLAIIICFILWLLPKIILPYKGEFVKKKISSDC